MKTTASRHSSVRAARSIARDTVHMDNHRGPGRPPKSTTAESPAVEPTNPADSLSAKAKRAIEATRSGFLAFIHTHGTWSAKRAEIVTPFVKAFHLFKEETKLGLADFVRQFVPDVPSASADYKKHSAYNAADHIMRLYREQARAKLAKTGESATKPKKVTPVQGMARLLAAMLPLISADQVDKLWDVAKTQLVGWSDGSLKNLRESVEKSAPLMALRPPRGFAGAVPSLRIAAPRLTDTDEQEEAPARTGTHG